MLTVLVITGCNYTKRLHKGQYLVESNKIKVHGDKISSNELEAIIKTPTNRKIFGSARFHLWLYNIPDTSRMYRKTDKRHKRIERKNVRRKRKGKKEKKLKDSFAEKTGNWLMKSVGEAPALLDSSKLSASRRNLSNFMLKKGYFDNVVTDSVVLDTAHKKAHLFYTIYTHQRYYIDTFLIKTEDKGILKPLGYSSNQTLIKQGDPADLNVLDEERNRLVTFLKDRGYFDMNKEYFTFRIDSNYAGKRKPVNTLLTDSTKKPGTDTGLNIIKDTMSIAQRQRLEHGVKLTMNIARVPMVQGDSTYLGNHKRYLINQIYIFTDHANGNDISKYDSIHYKEHIILFSGRPSMRPRELLQHIYINRGNYYRAREVEATYKKLSSLGIYRNTNINFKPNVSDPKAPYLDCFITMDPLKRQTYVVEANGTNRGGNLGIAGSVSYKNKNLFRGAEALKISLKGGIEAQQLLTNQDDATVGETVGIGEFKPLNTFNTIEFGPEVSLTIPKLLLPFNVYKFSKNSSPKTIFTASLNLQRRPDFSRGIQEGKLAYEFTHSPRDKSRPGRQALNTNIVFSHYVSPLKISAVKIIPSKEFSNRLNTIRDPFLKYSYTDHLILGCQYIFTLNVQRKNKNKDQFYLRAGIEQSGNLARLYYDINDAPKDSLGSYEILGIRFAQYVKFDADVRYYINFNKSSHLVYRINTGIGVPQKNFNEALPFEKSFYVGGSNGLRAFRARTVGPGGYYDTLVAFDKTGDILMEGNIEYRFDLIKIVKGALFYDVGNVWMLRKNPGKPEGQISSQFYKQLAMGAGIGLRFDLDFFIFRLDFAYPIRQPNLPDGEKWFFQTKPITNQWLYDYAERTGGVYRPFKSKLIVNIGIGYPF